MGLISFWANNDVYFRSVFSQRATLYLARFGAGGVLWTQRSPRRTPGSNILLGSFHILSAWFIIQSSQPTCIHRTWLGEQAASCACRSITRYTAIQEWIDLERLARTNVMCYNQLRNAGDIGYLLHAGDLIGSEECICTACLQML